VEQPALGANVALAEVVDAIDDGGAGRARDAVVVRLADAADGGDVVLDEVVLGEVCSTRRISIASVSE
jgi:hypothetical protein